MGIKFSILMKAFSFKSEKITKSNAFPVFIEIDHELRKLSQYIKEYWQTNFPIYVSTVYKIISLEI